jgi:hypothetical protein
MDFGDKRLNKLSKSSLIRTYSNWKKSLYKKLIVTLLDKIIPRFMKPEILLSFSQQLVTGPYPESDEISPHLPTRFP